MSSSKKSKVSAARDGYSCAIPTGGRDESCISVCFHRVVFMPLPDSLLVFFLLVGEVRGKS